MTRESFKQTLAHVRAAYAAVQNGALGRTRWVREGASSRTVTEPYREPTREPCRRCEGDGQVCNACGRPGDACQCSDDQLPTPMTCPACDGRTAPRPLSPFMRLHWWCMAQATKHDRPGRYTRLAAAFDWLGGRAARLDRWAKSRKREEATMRDSAGSPPTAGGPPGCPKHPVFSRACPDARCQRHWSPEGAPTPEEQLRRWVDGDPVCPNTRHECCPDFSCCRPHLLWPADQRRAYAQADPRTRERMLLGALGALTRDAGVSAHIVGSVTELTPRRKARRRD